LDSGDSACYFVLFQKSSHSCTFPRCYTAYGSGFDWYADYGVFGNHANVSLAYVLNLRGQDIPFNPVFLSYLFITLDRAVLFIEKSKVSQDVNDYLSAVGVEVRDYNDLWTFLRKREWGEGKVSKPRSLHKVSILKYV
jgi:Creatinase/Prolidase N-terminal domain